MNNGTPIATKNIDLSWKLGARDLIPEFFESVGIKPVAEIPFGRGTMRLYEPSVLDLRADFQRYISEREKRASAKHDVRSNIAAKNARIEERLAEIEKKLANVITILEVTVLNRRAE